MFVVLQEACNLGVRQCGMGHWSETVNSLRSMCPGLVKALSRPQPARLCMCAKEVCMLPCHCLRSGGGRLYGNKAGQHLLQTLASLTDSLHKRGTCRCAQPCKAWC